MIDLEDINERRNTKKIRWDRIEIGGGSPISVQSMTNTDTGMLKQPFSRFWSWRKPAAILSESAIFDEKCINTIREIKKETGIPLVADIHFDYRLALASIENGIDKLRINPGNIGGPML
jgi:(E)-4-hydroxy-3-methylbut-2-enyl-diphosphate synthase